MPKLLTQRKQTGVSHLKPNVVRGLPLNPNYAGAERYYERLRKLIDTMTKEVEQALKDLFAEPHAQAYFAEDASVSSQARILTNALAKKFNDLFATAAKINAGQMANETEKASSASLHSSIKQLLGGVSLSTTTLTAGPLNDILTATIAENVALIKSISERYLNGVQGAVMRSITTGNGLQDLIPYLTTHKKITLRRARFIAYDQTRKAFNGLSRGRMQAIGLRKFEWLHTAGSHTPRPLHISMSGKIYSFSEPPVIQEAKGNQPEIRGFPADLPKCRCKYVPVLDFNED